MLKNATLDEKIYENFAKFWRNFNKILTKFWQNFAVAGGLDLLLAHLLPLLPLRVRLLARLLEVHQEPAEDASGRWIAQEGEYCPFGSKRRSHSAAQPTFPS